MSETQILIQFKNSLITFVDELIEAFPQEPDLIILRIFLKDQISIEEVMNRFIHVINKTREDGTTLKDSIKARDDRVLVENELFQTIAKTKTLNFKKLWRSDNLDEDDRNTVWRWIDSFVLLSDRYGKIKSASS